MDIVFLRIRRDADRGMKGGKSLRYTSLELFSEMPSSVGFLFFVFF